MSVWKRKENLKGRKVGNRYGKLTVVKFLGNKEYCVNVIVEMSVLLKPLN